MQVLRDEICFEASLIGEDYHDDWRLSKDLMGVDLPSCFWNAHVALVVQLYVDLLVIRVLVRDHSLFVASCNAIAIEEVPNSFSVGFVVAEWTLVASSIGEDPPPLYDLVFLPFSYQFGSGLTVGVGPCAFLLAKLPPSWVAILVGVYVGAFSMFDSVFPLSWIDSNIP